MAPSVRRSLLSWYRANRRDLPWRRTSDPWAVWVSETMLQQTRVETVLRYYEPFLERFPSVRSLARAREPQVLSRWSGLGYYGRARNLRLAARRVMSEFGGIIPSDIEDLLTLPGVGAYTARAVASIAFGRPEAVVDGNVARVLARLGRISEPLRTRGASVKIEALARDLLAPRRAGEWNQAIMELGATVCTPRAPRCPSCPVRRHCGAAEEGRPDAFPVTAARPRTKRVREAIGVVEDSGGFLLRKRSEGRLLRGLWEFPAVELEEGAPPGRALAKELRRLGVRARGLREAGRFRHAILERRIESVVLRGRGERSSPTPGFRWVTRRGLATLPLSSAALRIREMLRSEAAS